MQVILHADQRPKQSHKDAILRVHPQELYSLGREFGLMLNQENIRSTIIQCRRNWSIFFVMETPLRDNDGAIELWRIKDHFHDHFVFCHHWSDEKWKSAMAGGGENKKIFQYCTNSSGAILYFRALQGHSGRNLIDPSLQDNAVVPDGFFKYIYHDGCAINSIYIPSSIRDWYREDKIRATYRQYSSVCGYYGEKNTQILTRSIWEPRVLHSTCTKHGRNIKTRCIGSTSILLWRKDWSSIRHDRTPSFFVKHSQLIVSRQLFGWNLKKKYTNKYMCHLGIFQRFLWNMIGWRNWVQKLLDNQKAPNQPNQTQIQIMIERRDPLSAQRERPVLSKSIHVALVKARTQFEKMTQITIERWDPLCAHNQSVHC